MSATTTAQNSGSGSEPEPSSRRRFTGLFPNRLLQHRPPRLWQEALLIALGYFLYGRVRNLVPEHVSSAMRHGRAVQHLQQNLHLNFELSVNKFVAAHEWLAQVMDYYYATLHFVVTAGVPALAVPGPFPGLSRRPHGAVRDLAARPRRLLALPARTASAAAAVRLHRHAAEVPHLGLAGRSEDRPAFQPVRRHAEPAHRLGAVVWSDDLLLCPAAVGPTARRAVPAVHARGDRRHREPLLHRCGGRPGGVPGRRRRAVPDVRTRRLPRSHRSAGRIKPAYPADGAAGDVPRSSAEPRRQPA